MSASPRKGKIINNFRFRMVELRLASSRVLLGFWAPRRVADDDDFLRIHSVWLFAIVSSAMVVCVEVFCLLGGFPGFPSFFLVCLASWSKTAALGGASRREELGTMDGRRFLECAAWQ